mmetsp:Transcript_10394/g.15097  ORF Transcript_10394/g.15097 Transcript_10394/m.15097 type:complete len:200 (+) Transcript_10394:298-897(+)
MPKRNAATVTALGQSSAYSRTCPHTNIKNSLACSTDHSYEYQGKGIIAEVFGKYGKQAKEYPLPHTASEVRAILRGGFRMGKTSRAIDVANIDTTDRQSKHDAIKEAFEILRHSNEMSSILLPQKDDLPSALPIFEYTDAGVLMEEEIQFNFFEPRYRFLAQEALSRDGTFILGQKHSSSLVKIVEHMFLPNGNISIAS